MEEAAGGQIWSSEPRVRARRRWQLLRDIQNGVGCIEAKILEGDRRKEIAAPTKKACDLTLRLDYGTTNWRFTMSSSVSLSSRVSCNWVRKYPITDA
jgi:hypothetical protein